jgi:lipopolysaccharide transport system ATP-binding protein
MQLISLNNVGRKFQKFTNLGDLPGNKYIPNSGSPQNGAFWALRNICMNVEQGEVVGIIGRNGSGKSTLLNIIAGILPVSEGEALVRGKTSALLTLGAGFQEAFTGKENIYLGGSLLGMQKQEIERRFADIVEFSELGDFINAPLGSYSSGMKLRLGFSLAIHNDFDILLTDEIIGVGDIYFQKKSFERIMDFKKQNKSLLIATQDMPLIERFCDRAVLLEDGKIFFNGSPVEAVMQYHKLLNKRKILSESRRQDMVTETRRWATDMEEWGTREGTKEVVLKGLKIINGWGHPVERIKPAEEVVIRGDFTVREAVADSHFGVAIFREDGVYCHGPNTQFDGLATGSMHKGEGYFELKYAQLLLMPGVYYLSVAVWDKKETFPYDYHKGKYRFEIIGDSACGQLLCLPSKWDNTHSQRSPAVPALECLIDKWESELNTESAAIQSMKCLNSYGSEDDAFVTGRDFKIKVDFKIAQPPNASLKSLILWIGIYRSDNIYCHGSVKKVAAGGTDSRILVYPKLRLLPGGYRVSAGIWDAQAKEFIAYSHGLKTFNMISERHDHGTVYLDHCWNWRLPEAEGD